MDKGEGSYSSAKMQLVNSVAPAKWAIKRVLFFFFLVHSSKYK